MSDRKNPGRPDAQPDDLAGDPGKWACKCGRQQKECPCFMSGLHCGHVHADPGRSEATPVSEAEIERSAEAAVYREVIREMGHYIDTLAGRINQPRVVADAPDFGVFADGVLDYIAMCPSRADIKVRLRRVLSDLYHKGLEDEKRRAAASPRQSDPTDRCPNGHPIAKGAKSCDYDCGGT